MVFFRGVKRGSGRDFRRDWFVEPTGLLERIHCSASGFVLVGRMVEDGRSVLRSDIRSLPVALSRVVARPEHLEKVLEGGLV